ncbi:MAG: TonB-dependent receptor [Syntrophobacteraceae bacterium]|nr:TonB-dependent receptor [Syntrophobacteraceae bacterium]
MRLHRHVQVQYNGFPLRDAADAQSTLQYFIEDLYSGSNLKQVEILKGSQSTLYGYLFMGSLISIGNTDLEPERSLGYELGVEQALLGDVLKVGLTWFRTEFDNLIIYDGFANRYANANEAVALGLETYLKLMPRPWLRLDLAYTYTDSNYRNEDEDQWIPKEYQPRNKVSGLLTVNLPRDLTVSLRALWQDEKIAPLYTPTWSQVRWEEPSVVTFDAALSWTFLKEYQAYVRVENLLDEDYTESAHVMPGRSVFGGVRLIF